ncbi:MAG: response regulator [Bacteroidia bacterium]
MIKPREIPTILYAEDDPNDIALCKAAREEAQVQFEFRFVLDGLQLMDYLGRKGKFADTLKFPSPELILLDLSIPGKSGQECLREIKQNPETRAIPVVIFSTCNEASVIRTMYESGAASYIVKPMHFLELIEVWETLDRYWFKTSILPDLGLAM